jgi:hypothetical protein
MCGGGWLFVSAVPLRMTMTPAATELSESAETWWRDITSENLSSVYGGARRCGRGHLRLRLAVKLGMRGRHCRWVFRGMRLVLVIRVVHMGESQSQEILKATGAWNSVVQTVQAV